MIGWPHVKLLRGAALAGLVAGLVWTGGFAWFVRSAAELPRETGSADGIVVLTGGAERVETGLRLLAAGRARLLLVSGVDRAVDLGHLARRGGLDPAPLAPLVTLGRSAASTRGNAREIADWARAHGLRSLIVVTAFYHMPRALAEIAHSAPDLVLHPAPVMPSSLGGPESWPALRLLAGEYSKWLVVETGLSHLLPLREHGSGPRVESERLDGGRTRGARA